MGCTSAVGIHIKDIHKKRMDKIVKREDNKQGVQASHMQPYCIMK